MALVPLILATWTAYEHSSAEAPDFVLIRGTHLLHSILPSLPVLSMSNSNELVMLFCKDPDHVWFKFGGHTIATCMQNLMFLIALL
jgi:hypothetical protein